MPGTAGRLSGTLCLLVGGDGRTIKVRCVDGGSEERRELWNACKKDARVRTKKGNKITAAYRYDEMTAVEVVHLLYSDRNPEQYLADADAVSGTVPYDRIGLVAEIREQDSGLNLAQMLLEQHHSNPKVIADALLAAREYYEEGRVFEHAMTVVGQMNVLYSEPSYEHNDAAGEVYRQYYERLGRKKVGKQLESALRFRNFVAKQ